MRADNPSFRDNECQFHGCHRLGDNYRDYSIGGCGDIRMLCAMHALSEDKKQKKIDADRMVTYQRSLVTYYEKRAEEERDKLLELLLDQ